MHTKWYPHMLPNFIPSPINHHPSCILHLERTTSTLYFLSLPQHGYLSDPPNVDILEVEHEDEEGVKEELRHKMIDGESGEQSIETFVVVPDKVRVEYVVNRK